MAAEVPVVVGSPVAEPRSPRGPGLQLLPTTALARWAAPPAHALQLVWQYLEVTRTYRAGWVDMDPVISRIIEAGRRQGETQIQYEVRGRTYMADLEEGIQRTIRPPRTITYRLR